MSASLMYVYVGGRDHSIGDCAGRLFFLDVGIWEVERVFEWSEGVRKVERVFEWCDISRVCGCRNTVALIRGRAELVHSRQLRLMYVYRYVCMCVCICVCGIVISVLGVWRCSADRHGLAREKEDGQCIDTRRFRDNGQKPGSCIGADG